MEEKYINSWTRRFAEHALNLPTENEEENIPTELFAEFKVYKKTWKILEEMQEIEKFDTDSAWNKLYSKIEDEKDSGPHNIGRKFAFNRTFAIAASVILLIGLGGFLFQNQVNKVFTYANTNLTAQKVSLPDGSVVFLNAMATLNYTKSFGNKSRTVELNGEAFFEVSRDETKPFIVKTNNAIVKVLGTSFNVNTNTDYNTVIVKTGRVEVINANNADESVVLLPGEIASTFDNKIQKSINRDENYLSWLNQKLIFKALPLSLVIDDLMKTYHCNIVLADTSLARLKITSTFDNDSIDDVLKSIALAFNLKIEKEGKKYILVSN